MSSRTIFLAKVIGLFLLCMAALMALSKTSLLTAIAATVHEPGLLLAYSIISLAAGMAMVVGHNVWSGGPAAIIVTLVGWAALIKGLLLLFLPSDMFVTLYGRADFGDRLYGYAALFAVIGLYLVYSGFRAARAKS
jgi:hypothetical protein